MSSGLNFPCALGGFVRRKIAPCEKTMTKTQETCITLATPHPPPLAAYRLSSTCQ